MSDAVLIALITGSLTLIGVIITAISGNKVRYKSFIIK